MKTSSEILPSAGRLDLDGFFAECRTLVDAELNHLIPEEIVDPASVHSAIRWSVFAGGKRFRPALLFAVGETFGASAEALLFTACAVEMIHTYSLIHDDLPSMDNDDLRRGRPTCHIRFDEATAILAGDALQTLAFQTIAEDQRLPPQKRVRVISELARASGTPHGMIAGQAYDLEAEARQVTEDELGRIHRLKTAALILSAARCGGIIADANEVHLATATNYATQLGLLFQITDDLLDVTATAEHLGKTPGKDARSEKATYAALYGMEGARRRAEKVHQQACAVLESIDHDTQLLRSVADFILHRSA
jgi:geranylgeranyl diphosphate synthase, type II